MKYRLSAVFFAPGQLVAAFRVCGQFYQCLQCQQQRQCQQLERFQCAPCAALIPLKFAKVSFTNSILKSIQVEGRRGHTTGQECPQISIWMGLGGRCLHGAGLVDSLHSMPIVLCGCIHCKAVLAVPYQIQSV